MFDPIDDQQQRDDEGIEKMLTDEIRAQTARHPADECDCEIDHEYYERRRMVEHLSCSPEGLTGSEIADIMNGD